MCHASMIDDQNGSKKDVSAVTITMRYAIPRSSRYSDYLRSAFKVTGLAGSSGWRSVAEGESGGLGDWSGAGVEEAGAQEVIEEGEEGGNARGVVFDGGDSEVDDEASGEGFCWEIEQRDEQIVVEHGDEGEEGELEGEGEGAEYAGAENGGGEGEPSEEREKDE